VILDRMPSKTHAELLPTALNLTARMITMWSRVNSIPNEKWRPNSERRVLAQFVLCVYIYINVCTYYEITVLISSKFQQITVIHSMNLLVSHKIW